MKLPILVALVALCAPLRAETAPDLPPVSTRMVGGAHAYAARPGDSLTSVSARFGIDVAPLARANGLAPTARLALGEELAFENTHLVPGLTDAIPRDAILLNVPQRMLFLLRGGEMVAGYPVAAGRPTWPTPIKEATIANKAIDKTWVVPPSIQEEMRREGKPVLAIVPPGPDNPLGHYWLGLSLPGCGIHSTNAPTSIYRLTTHGCVRLHPDDAAALYERVEVGEPVHIVYQPLLLAALPDGHVCLEAHADAYHRAPPPEHTLDELIARDGLADRVDRERALAVIAAREGLARDVTRGGSGGSCQ